MSFGGLTIEGQSWQGNFQQQGPWEWKGPVTVSSSGFTLTCDTSFKLWPTADFSDFERVEATGNVTVEGRYVTADNNAWDITGHANSATYDRESQRGTLSGAVVFEATNSVTGAALTAAAEKLTYDAKTQGFSFERGDSPVRMEWQEPADKDEAPPAASDSGT
jgi:lipopolysaccharide export system protein LptA